MIDFSISLSKTNEISPRGPHDHKKMYYNFQSAHPL